jgi:hypothetical protein
MTLKGLLCIFFGFGAGAWFGYLALKKFLLMGRAKYWPSVHGLIIDSAIVVDYEQKKTHFKVRYEFVIGERIESQTPRIAGDWFFSNKKQEAFVARYSAGQLVEVFYDPRNPKINCLDREDQSGIIALGIVSIGAILLSSFLSWIVFFRS